jgi:protein phosphatase
MGTTLTAALLHGTMLMLANVGDSRIYRIREGDTRQLTRDHSLIAEQVRRGLLTEEQARFSQSRNVITRSIGHRPRVEIDINEMPVQPGDAILLCSDGLHGLVDPHDLASIIEQRSVAEAVTALVDLANARGGIDNISCVLIRVLTCPSPFRDQDEPAQTDELEALAEVVP